MPRVLLLFAHPALEKSRVHRRLVERVPRGDGITLHDLYEAYPDYQVDVEREQALLTSHDLVVMQFPFYWYSVPPLLKQWQDLVLEHGWAYGSTGTALHGTPLLTVLTTGGSAAAYTHGGYNRFTVRELLAPLEQTAYLCGMPFAAPYLIHGTHRLTEDEIEREAGRYGRMLDALQEGRVAVADAHAFELERAAQEAS